MSAKDIRLEEIYTEKGRMAIRDTYLREMHAYKCLREIPARERYMSARNERCMPANVYLVDITYTPNRELINANSQSVCNESYLVQSS